VQPPLGNSGQLQLLYFGHNYYTSIINTPQNNCQLQKPRLVGFFLCLMKYPGNFTQYIPGVYYIYVCRHVFVGGCHARLPQISADSAKESFSVVNLPHILCVSMKNSPDFTQSVSNMPQQRTAPCLRDRLPPPLSVWHTCGNNYPCVLHICIYVF